VTGFHLAYLLQMKSTGGSVEEYALMGQGLLSIAPDSASAGSQLGD